MQVISPDLHNIAQAIQNNQFWKNPVTDVLNAFNQSTTSEVPIVRNAPIISSIWEIGSILGNWFIHDTVNSEYKTKLGVLYSLPQCHSNLQSWSSEYFNPYNSQHSSQPAGITAIGIASGIHNILNMYGIDTIPASLEFGPHPAIPEITRLPHNDTWLHDLVGTIYGGLTSIPNGLDDANNIISQLDVSALNLAASSLFDSPIPNHPNLPMIESVPNDWTYSVSPVDLMKQRLNHIVELYDILVADNVLQLYSLATHVDIVNSQIAREKLWWANNPITLDKFFDKYYVTSTILSAYSTPLILQGSAGIFGSLHN